MCKIGKSSPLFNAIWYILLGIVMIILVAVMVYYAKASKTEPMAPVAEEYQELEITP